jgi:predicted TIM-barrel fold metal-dependent hydrolase
MRRLISSRRNFLRQTAASIGALSSFGPLLNATEPPALKIPTIDSHVHFYDPTRSQGVPWPPKDIEILFRPRLPSDFRTLTHDLRIAGVVVVEASPWAEDNQWILDLATANPLIVGFIGHLDPGQPEFAANLKRFAANPIFRGLRFHEDVLSRSLGQSAFEKDLKLLEERRLSLDVVGGPGLLPLIPRLAKLAPELRIIIDHLPFRDWSIEPAAMRNSIHECARLPNVYAKISDVPRQVNGRLMTNPSFYFPALDALSDEFGPYRSMYGSNWPVSDLVAPYSTVHKIVATWIARKGSNAEKRFFWKNSLAAYNWQPRGEAARLLAK